MSPPASHRHHHRKRPVVRSLFVLCAMVVLAALVALGLGAAAHGRSGGGSGHHPTAHRNGHRAAHRSGPGTTSKTGPGSATTFLGPYGVESKAIIAQNQKPGTTAWELHPSGTGSIAGFANTTYASIGQTVTLYVTTTAPTFHVIAYRMGYYQGKGGREIWRSPTLEGVRQPSCPVTPTVNMVSCTNWTPSVKVHITKAFFQGDYLLKLVGSGNQQSYILLTVWQPSDHAPYLMMARSLTEQGWNTYGGYSYYTGHGPCTLGQTSSYPQCNRARIVSFARPFATGNGASDFLGSEYPLVRFMEQHGLDVAYCTDITVSAHPGLLAHHKVLLSLDHDETWTSSELTGVKSAVAHGMNVVFFGAAPIVRHARLQSSPLGPDTEEVDYRTATEDPLHASGNPMTVTGNTWATPPTNVSVTSFVGSEYSGFVLPTVSALPFTVYQATAWIFAGTGLHDGQSIPNVIGSDINHLNPTAEPADVQVFGHSPLPLADVYTNQGNWNGVTYSDMTYYTVPGSGAGIFESGTVNWINAINPCAVAGGTCTNAPIAKITGNLLDAMGRGPAGKLHPSVPNWKTVTPPGS